MWAANRTTFCDIILCQQFALQDITFPLDDIHLGQTTSANSKTLHISISHHWPADDSYNRHIQVEFSNAKQNPKELMPKYLSR